MFLPPADFLPYNRGTSLDGNPDFAVFNGQYEEVTDSLLNLSGSKPLAIITAREELKAEDWEKLKTFSTLAKQGDIPLCLMSLPDLNGRNTMETYYADEVTLKSILRSEKGILIVENSIIRAKWNLDTYPAKLIRHATGVKQLAAWNSWGTYRYGFCLSTGFLLITWTRKKRKTSPAKINTGDYIYKGIFVQHTIRPILISIHCKTTPCTIYYSAHPSFLKHLPQGYFIRCDFYTHPKFLNKNMLNNIVLC